MITELIITGIALSFFVLLANIAEKKEVARIILNVGLVMICAGEILFSLFLLVVGKYLSFMTEFSPSVFYCIGGGFLLAGLVGALMLPTRVRSNLHLPINPDSPLHASGLFFITQVIVLFIFFALTINPLETNTNQSYEVTKTELALNLLIYFFISFLAVGFPVRRNFSESVQRLTLWRPTFRQVGLALLFCLLLFLSDSAFSSLEAKLFPQTYQKLHEIVGNISSGLGADALAVLLFGISAGVGEELVFRGALQPRYGLLLTSFFFAVMHIPLYGITLVIVSAFAAGVLLGFLRNKTNTTCAIIAHALYDIMVVVLNYYF